MPDVLIRNVPEPVLADLKLSAAENRRSLQAEVSAILEDAVEERRRRARFIRTTDEIRARLAATGRDFGDSVELIREDRER